MMGTLNVELPPRQTGRKPSPKGLFTFEAEPFESEFELLTEAEVEDEFRMSALPDAVQDAYRLGAPFWAVVVTRAIAAGVRDPDQLANVVFFLHHPERMHGDLGRPIDPDEPQFRALAKEWKAWRELVKPMLTAAPSPSPGTGASAALKYGVPGGTILSAYLKSRSRGYHTGIDVSTSPSPGQGASDPRRGLPVYATIRTAIDIATLNRVQVAPKKEPPWKTGLGIAGHGSATLREAQVHISGKKNRVGAEYGGVVGLACRYGYTGSDGAPRVFTLYVEYWHLITPDYLPKNGQGRVIPLSEWIAAGKGSQIGYGPGMRHGATLEPRDFATSPLVGYLGATQWPHVHIHVNYGEGNRLYLFYPRLDPAAVIR